MERTQFTFYVSIYEAIRRIKNKNARADAYDAVCNYALFGIEPDLDSLSDSAAIAFISAKPNLDVSRRKAESGKRGGNRKQTESKLEANSKQTGSEIEKEKEIEIEDECPPPTPPHTPAEAPEKQNPLYDPDVAKVMSAYLDKVNSTPSTVCTAELLDFLNDLDADVICHAIDVAVDENKRSWNYIKAILQRYRTQRLRHLADVLQDAAKHQKETRGKPDNPDATNNQFLKICQAEQEKEGIVL